MKKQKIIYMNQIQKMDIYKNQENMKKNMFQHGNINKCSNKNEWRRKIMLSIIGKQKLKIM